MPGQAMQQIRVSTFDGPGAKPVIRSVPWPKVGKRGALIKIGACGVCGTDLHILKGHWPKPLPWPFTLGHELGGVLVEVGAEFSEDFMSKPLTVGSKVMIPPLMPCGHCYYCIHYPQSANKCLTPVYYGRYLGFDKAPHLWGGWAEYVYVDLDMLPGTKIYKLPDDMSLRLGALSESRLQEFCRTSQSLIVLGLLAVLVAAGLTALGWWRAVGFNARSQWRDLRLLWLPAVLVLLPLVGGVRTVAPGALAIFVIGYALTGFAEEAFARGILLRVLQPRSVLSAVLISSLLFGVMHLSNVMFRSSPALVVAQAIGAVCFGVGFAALRLRTGTIWPLLVLHMLTDLFGQLARLPAESPFFVTQDIVLLCYGLYLVHGSRRHQVAEESGDR